jgi:hypothetical protein
MNHSRYCSLAALAAALVFAGSALGQTHLPISPFPDRDDGYFTFYFDNDAFSGNDRDYSNGLRFSWISGDRKLEELGSVQRFLRPLSGDSDSLEIFKKITPFEDPAKGRYNYGFSLTQLMYTPDDRDAFSQPEGQRRYAGWLGLGFSLHVKDEKILNSVEFILGTTGRNSLAESTQDFIHDLGGMDKFNGWDDQVPNEITADISFVQKRRAEFAEFERGAFRIDGLTEWGLRLGTFRTDAHLGGFFRAGYHLPPDFSDPRLSETAYSHSYFGDGEGYDGNWSVYSLFGATVRGVAYDATLDGPVFRDFETGNKREPLVGEIFCGVGVRYRRVELSYVHTWKTEEYRDQAEPGDFGTVALRMKF